MSKVLSQYVDFLNKEKTRNTENTIDSQYNCGGFALKTFSWYCPYKGTQRLDEIFQLALEGFTTEEIEDIIIEEDVAFMINQFGHLREVIDEDDLQEGEELIAYRIFIEFSQDKDGNIEDVDSDFHFKVLRNGQWMHKMGGKEVELCADVYDDIWDEGDYAYDSSVKFLALRLEA